MLGSKKEENIIPYCDIITYDKYAVKDFINNNGQCNIFNKNSQYR